MQPAAPSETLRSAFVDLPRLCFFIVVMLVTLASPVLLFVLGLPPKQEVYKGIAQEAGKFAYLDRVIFEEQGDIDILFFGSSLLRAAIDAPTLKEASARITGRPLSIVVAGVNWPGWDMQYFLLRDLLEHRKVKLLVLSMPVGQQDTFLPHIQLFRFLRLGDYPNTFQGLSMRQGLSLYGTMVLGAPRQALNLARANQVSDWSGEIPEAGRPRSDEHGFYGSPFQRFVRTPPGLRPADLLYSPATAGQFQFLGRMPNDYQLKFLHRTADLLSRAHVPVVILNTPLGSEIGQTIVQERIFWPDVFGAATRIIGVPSSVLFEGLASPQIEKFYMDDHLNRNGREYFTGAIVPALLEVYESVH
jgi:hypothetical protein